MGSRGHIDVTVGATKYPLVVDTQSYQEVDIVDFAPQAISGSPAFSELGLYLDVAQDGFGHGFGKWRYSEPKSYAYSGNLVDTRFGHATLMTAPVARSVISTGNISKFYKRGYGVLTFYSPYDNQSIPVVYGDSSSQTVLYAWAPTTGYYMLVHHIVALHSNKGPLFNGKYIFWPTDSATTGLVRMMFAKVTSVSGAGPYVVTLNLDTPFETTDMWAGGIMDRYEDAAAEIAITASGTNTITMATSPGAITGDWVCLWIDNVGVVGNKPVNYSAMTIFGGYMWGAEKDTNWLHYFAEIDASDAEGGGLADLGVIPVGPPGSKIVNTCVFNNQLWVFREDGAWVVGEDKRAYHTLDFGRETHPDNGRLTIPWNGFLIFNIRNTLYKFRSGLQNITPPPFTGDPPAGQFGDFQSATIRGGFIYFVARSNIAFTDEADPEDAAGFMVLLAYDGVGWHKLYTVPQRQDGSTENLLTVSTDPFTDQLYIVELEALPDTNGISIYTIQLQTYSDQPYASYPTTGNHYLYTSYYDLGMLRIPKSLATVTLEGVFPTYTSVVVQYRIDDTPTWVTLGTITSSLTELSFAATAQCKRIQFRLNLQTTSSSVTPLVRAIILKLMMRPDVLYGVSCNVLVSDDLSDANGLPLGLTAAQIRAGLKAARASVSPITFTDIHGTSASAYLSSLQFFIATYEDTNITEEIAKCTFVYV